MRGCSRSGAMAGEVNQVERQAKSRFSRLGIPSHAIRTETRLALGLCSRKLGYSEHSLLLFEVNGIGYR